METVYYIFDARPETIEYLGAPQLSLSKQCKVDDCEDFNFIDGFAAQQLRNTANGLFVVETMTGVYSVETTTGKALTEAEFEFIVTSRLPNWKPGKFRSEL